MSKKKSNFGKQVVDAAKGETRKKFGYLNLPEDVKMLTIEEKTRKIKLDFLPYTITSESHPHNNAGAEPGELWYTRPFKVHANVGVDNKTIICPTSIGKPCPICTYIREKMKKGADWEDVMDIATKDRNLYAAIPIDSNDHDEIVYVWNMSHHLFQKELNSQLLELGEEYGCFASLEDGKTLTLKLRWKTYKKYTYPEVVDITFEDRDNYKESVLETVPSLDDMLIVYTYEEIEKMFFDRETEPDDEEIETVDDEEEVETTSTRSKYREKPSKEKEQDDASKDDEEEEKESKRTRKKSTDKCPFGHKFGVDFEEYPKDCEECDVWNQCDDEHEKLK